MTPSNHPGNQTATLPSVLLVADHPDWALGTIANHLAVGLQSHLACSTLYSQSPDFKASFRQEVQKGIQGVIYLSSRAFYKFGSATPCPCIAVIHHMEGSGNVAISSLRHADIVAVPSNQWLQRISAFPESAGKLRRIFYSLDIHVFHPAPRATNPWRLRLGINPDCFVLGYAGIPHARKGLDSFWDCLRSLLQNSPVSFVTRIIGRKWIPQQIPSDLAPYVYLEPNLPQNAMSSFFNSLDGYLCTSTVEGGPYPVMEAMASECVVFSTTVGIVPELIRHGHSGFLLDDNDLPGSFRQAFLSVHHNPSERANIGRQARLACVAVCDTATAIKASHWPSLLAEATVNYHARHPWNRLLKTIHQKRLF